MPSRSVKPGTVVLRAGKEKPLRQRHPWVFSGAIAKIADDVSDGAVADVLSGEGEFLARGIVNRRSQIVVRVLTFRADERVDAAFFEGRVRRAVALRQRLPAVRYVNAESDGLPGLVVDAYGDHCVIQISALGIDRVKGDVVRAIERAFAPKSIFERSDVEGRAKEGLEPSVGLLSGTEPPELVEVVEKTFTGRDALLLVDVRHGHKTGAYLDQRESRRVVGGRSAGATVLNVFSYTGGFGLHAALEGAEHVLNVDSSADALALSERIAARNGVSARVEHRRADAFEALRRLRDEGRSFDMVVLDPPKFAHTVSQVDRAARAYKDLARVAMQITKAGGFVATFSCSGAISADLFQKITFSASVEANREAQIAARFGQPEDHPVLLTFPEGEYLKGLLCRLP
jgi:23S rRNA (cytosine1962-C5)-methyltransferase